MKFLSTEKQVDRKELGMSAYLRLAIVIAVLGICLSEHLSEYCNANAVHCSESPLCCCTCIQFFQL